MPELENRFAQRLPALSAVPAQAGGRQADFVIEGDVDSSSPRYDLTSPREPLRHFLIPSPQVSGY